MVVVGRDGAAHAHRADDPPVLHQRDRASAEDESIVAERRNVVGEELALAEPLFEVARRCLEGRRRIGLRASDLGRHPEGAVHTVADDQATGVIDDRDGDVESKRPRLDKTPFDALAGPVPCERHSQGTSTQISPPSTVTG